ncbi:MAG: hypothetical protein ACYC2T_10940 [Bacillota bacterium]
MEQGCPLCNNLSTLEASCPSCGHAMEDWGQLANFAGPYSPYEETPIPVLSGLVDTPDTCTHLYHCPACNRDQRVPVPLTHM